MNTTDKHKSNIFRYLAILLIEILLFIIPLAAQTGLDHASCFADIKNKYPNGQYEDVFKLFREGDKNKIKKKMKSWRYGKNEVVATAVLICSQNILSLQSYIDENLLNKEQAIATGLEYFNQEEAKSIINLFIDRPGFPTVATLKQAIGRDFPEIIKLIGLNINTGVKAISYAIKDGNATNDYSMLEQMIATGINLNIQTPILIDTSVRFKMSINSNNSLLKRYDEGPTPLFYAIEYGNPKAVELLLKHGADKNQKFRIEDGTEDANTGLGSFVDAMANSMGGVKRYRLVTPSEYAEKLGIKDIYNMLK